jgi:hypothetical protein
VRSLHEVEAHWSIDDLLDAHMAIDVWDELERKSYVEAAAKAKERH